MDTKERYPGKLVFTRKRVLQALRPLADGSDPVILSCPSFASFPQTLTAPTHKQLVSDNLDENVTNPILSTSVA